MGSGCGSVGRAVASDTREAHGSLIQSLENFYTEHLHTVNVIEKTIIKEKMPGMTHLKIIFLFITISPGANVIYPHWLEMGFEYNTIVTIYNCL